MRRIPALLAAAALLSVSLVGCSVIPGFGECEPILSSGPASSIVTASGTKPTIDFPTPLVAGETPEVSTLKAGEGELITHGSQVDFDFAIEYGTGQDAGGNSSRVAAGLEDHSISQALQCAHVGDRLALVTTAKDVGDGFGVGALDQVDPATTFVVVIDITASYLGKANGFNQLPTDGMPTVVTQVDGQPGIAVPAEPPPTESSYSTIKAGDGAKIEAGDQAVLHYSLWTWPSPGAEPSSIVSTWDSGTAANLVIASYDAGGSIPPAMFDALVGQRVGSQVLVVIAPGDDGFSPEGLLTGMSADDTVIAVIDVLGIDESDEQN